MRRRSQQQEKDPHVWRAQFRGLHVLAFGREQVLDYAVDIEVVQAQAWPCVWVARDVKGGYEPFTQAGTPEEAMRLVAGAFVDQVTPWQPFVTRGLLPEQPAKPWPVSGPPFDRF